MCVWQGVATVVGWAERSPQARQEVVLATTAAGGYSMRVEYGGYEIELLDLAPPRVGTPKQSDYKLTLVVR